MNDKSSSMICWLENERGDRINSECEYPFQNVMDYDDHLLVSMDVVASCIKMHNAHPRFRFCAFERTGYRHNTRASKYCLT